MLKHHDLDLYQLVRHFVVYDGKDYVDVTPFDDLRDKNYFIPIKINLYNTFIQSPISINKIEEWETKIMYYVYCYIDPRNDQPFYVGKGKQDRAFTHIKHTKKERKNKNTTRTKLAKSIEILPTEPSNQDRLIVANLSALATWTRSKTGGTLLTKIIQIKLMSFSISLFLPCFDFVFEIAVN